ncbi:methylmalonyl-CoA mutase family protein [Fibrella sp. WM1]|uniref:methylmalonyl-CoA mutase family protein n=1 Tax=Fibrella musci TaxID=3242485 RepID=UPI003520CFBE
MLPTFSTVTYADWLAQVQKDLKDPDAYETLRWATPEGFTVEPYYTAEHVGTLPLADIQAAQRTQPGWFNAPAYTINAADVRAQNGVLREAIANGADALLLHVPADINLSLLLNGIKLSDTPICFAVSGDATVFMTALRNVAPYQLRGGLICPADQSVEQVASVLTAAEDSPQFRVIHIDGIVIHNAGATATQELAFTLAQLADAFDQLTEAGFSPEQLVAKTTIRLAVGTSYFLEIAKLRAMRVLLARFGAGHGLAATPFLVHAETSAFYEAAATPYTNLLRSTTEAMAAVIGGCDWLTVRPYDAVLAESVPESVGTLSTGFSQRIARNVSTLLLEESQLGRVADPSAGSYYVETLTHQLVETAWALFLDVEQKGGYANAAGYVREAIDAAYQAKQAAVQQGRVLVGVTKFRHDEGGVPTPTTPTAAQASGLPVRRLAESFE